MRHGAHPHAEPHRGPTSRRSCIVAEQSCVGCGSRNYNHHMESRTRDLETVSRLRSARQEAVAQAARGDVATLVQSPSDSLFQQVYVVKLLDVHPRLGKVAGRRLLSELHVAPLARVCDLNPDQVKSLLAVVGDQS